MIRLAISVEGSTEKEFVRSLLADHLRLMEVEPTPIVIGRRVKGGNVSVERLVSDMVRLSWSFDAVTSLVDFYGFLDKKERTVGELEEHIGQEIRRKVPDQKTVMPYVQKHEFEGLLFSDVRAFAGLLHAPDEAVLKLQSIRSQFPTPEDINDNHDTAPSKRIARIVPRYEKAVDGPLVAMEIGLTAIRAECPRFHQWVTRLEALGSPV